MPKKTVNASKIFLLNFKEICQFYKGMVAERELLKSTLDKAKADDWDNYANVFILRQLDTCIAIADTTFKLIEAKHGKVIADVVKGFYMDGKPDKELSEMIDMPLRTFARKKVSWVGSVEEDVIKTLGLTKGIHFGEACDIREPVYKYPEINGLEDTKEWSNTLKKCCKGVRMHLKNIKSCSCTIMMAHHTMMNLRSVSSGDCMNSASRASKDEVYARAIEKIDRFTKKKKEYIDKIQWLFQYLKNEPNPIARTMVPLIYINGRKYDNIAEESEVTNRALRFSVEKAMRYPGRKEL